MQQNFSGVNGSKAKFTMEGGTIKNAKLISITGGVKICNDATFEMNNGTIQNNTVTGWVDDSGKLFNAGGAGIFIQQNAPVEMNGGIIKENTSNIGQGGGICVVDWWKDNEQNYINTGQTIDTYSH